MKVIMLVTSKGSKNGLVVETFEKDKEYDIPESLYTSFKKMGVIVDSHLKNESKKELEKETQTKIEEETQEIKEAPNKAKVKPKQYKKK